MSLEATVVCLDNSEWTRNGDFRPTRWQAQADAVNLLAGAKTQANPENTVRGSQRTLQTHLTAVHSRWRSMHLGRMHTSCDGLLSF